MKILRSTFILTMSMLAIGLIAHAQAARTWVSGTGDDANPCSRTAPCKTFAGAISKTATGGEIDAMDPGGFGAVTITKPITIDGGGGQIASTLVSGTNGIVIDLSAGGVVTLRNLQIQGTGTGLTGIDFLAGTALHVEHCVIQSFTQHGIGVDLATGAQIFIDDTTSQDNKQDGLNVVGTTGGNAGQVHVNISNSHFSNNAIGVNGGDSSIIVVRSSDANGNTGAGFQSLANNFASTMSIADSTAANNGGAGVAAGGGTATATVRVSNDSIFSNSVGFQVGTKGSIQSFDNNANTGSGAPSSKIALQ